MEALVQWCRQFVSSSSTFIDVGTHVGNFSTTLAPYCGHVHAFELERTRYHQLCGLIALHKLTNVDAHFFEPATTALDDCPKLGDVSLVKITTGLDDVLAVLNGAKKTLLSSRPCLVIEAAGSDPGLRLLLDELHYDSVAVEGQDRMWLATPRATSVPKLLMGPRVHVQRLALPPLRVYMHVCAMNNWREIVGELFERMAESGLLGVAEKVAVCLVGDTATTAMYPPSASKFVALRSNDPTAFERTTLNNLLLPDAKAASTASSPFYALYLHSKGVQHKGKNPGIRDWVALMTHFLVSRFHECVKALNEGADVAGVNLHPTPVLHFSGNFWWATSTHLAKLPPCTDPSYNGPEFWVTSLRAGKYKALFESGVDHYEIRCAPRSYAAYPTVTRALIEARADAEAEAAQPWTQLRAYVREALTIPHDAVVVRASCRAAGFPPELSNGVVGIPNLHIFNG